MSSCLSGGGRAAYRLDLEVIKSPSTSWTSHSSSPSSTLSESSNSPITIITRKPRTPRKRPNQTYNEAAALLSTAYPKIFSSKQLTKSGKFTKSHSSFPHESPDLLLPFQIQAIDNSGFLLHPPILEKPNISNESKVVNSCEKPCQSPGEINSRENSADFCGEFQEDFDAESILDEEIEEGIDGIIGKLNVNNCDSLEESSASSYNNQMINMNTCYGYPVWLGHGNYFDFGYGMRREAFRNKANEQVDWWRFPSVNVVDITPKFNKNAVEKKKKKKIEKIVELKNLDSGKENSAANRANKDNSAQKTPKEEPVPTPNDGLHLKLNYDVVLNAWSDRSSPFPDEFQGSEASGNDVQARLAKIDLFTESGGLREASVLRYKEKRRTRLFSKKIRYQVRKVNADRRPRMKGRFVRRPGSPEDEQG